MQRIIRYILLLLLFIIPLNAHSQQRDLRSYAGDKKVNFGIKGGFNSSMMLISELNIDGQAISNIQNTYELGYFASFFMRINFDRHFLQPELSYNINCCEINFTAPKNEEDITAMPHQYAISSRICCFEIPILYGYNFVKEGPYQMAVFGGPKFRYIWDKHTKNTYHNFSQTNIKEEMYPFNTCLTMGIAVTISRIFFDFRYDIGLHNISKKISYTPTNLEDVTENVSDEKQIHFHRRYNTLSFSLGLYF